MNTENDPLNLTPGTKLAGVYLLQSPIETGGAPVIWLAQDEVLGRPVALHFLPSAVAGDERALAEIRQEVKRTRPLIHPGILRIYDLVEGEGWAAVATDAFEGERLSALLEGRKRFEVREVESWLEQICVALEEAHRVKIVHRDLAAENVFVTGAGKWLLANFGIGRAVQNSLQRAGEMPADSARWSSASPQILDAAGATPADDVYGVGALFYHLLAGEPVFAGGDVPAKIRESIPARISDVRFEADDRGEPIPASWENVIAACLNKNRDERPAGPAEIVSSIRAYAAVVEPPAAIVVVPPGELVESPAPLPEAASEAEAPVFALAKSEATPAEDLVEKSEAPALAESAASAEDAIEVAAPAEVEPEAAAMPATPPAALEPIPLAAHADPPVEPAGVSNVPESPAPPAKPPAPAYYADEENQEDAFSTYFPKRFRFPAAVAAAVIFVLLLINGAFNSKEASAPAPAVVTSDPADREELTAVKNTARENPPAAAESAAPAPSSAEAPATSAKLPYRAEMLLAAAPPAKAPVDPAPVPLAGATDKQVAEQTAAVEKLKADLAAAEQQQQARLKEKQTAEAAVAEAEKAIEAKTKAAAAAKKDAQELTAARKKREDDQKAAELAAQAAQQLAAEKARAAEAAKKAVADFEAQNRDKLAAQDKADGELQTLQRTLADQRKAANDSARALASVAAGRQQQLAAIEQAEQQLATARSAAAKTAEDAQRKLAVNSERKKLDDEISAMRAMFEQKMKDIEDRRRQLESPSSAPSPATPAPLMPAPATPRPIAATTPPPAPLQLMAARTEPPVAATPGPAPLATPTVATPPPVAVSGGSTNSLGLRFVPIGDAQFATWLTRWKDFDTFARAVNLKSTAWRGPGFRQGPDHPVVNITWNEALAFCKWLTDKEHKEGSLPASQFYRLPYDMEWSRAVGLPAETGKSPEARDMGIPDVYPWGTDWPPPKGAGNYTGEETGSDVAIKGYDDGFAWTSPVGSFPPNKAGLYDMGGNVWQWCMDTWNSDSKARVLRGASWYNGALKLSLLASCRVHATPDSSTDNYGFRIVKATEAVASKPARR